MELVGADENYREGGYVPNNQGRMHFYEAPVCARGAKSFSHFGENRTAAHSMAGSEHDCPKFITLIPGLQPKDHIEMDLVDQQREWQRKESEAQRAWQAAEADRAATRHSDSMRVALAANSSNVWSNVLSGSIGAAATLGAVWVARLLSN